MSLVSKAFAAAVKEQHKLVVSGALLTGQNEQLFLATLKQAPTACLHVTQLTLKDIERNNVAWSCALISQSSLLETVTTQLTPESGDHSSNVAACEIFQSLLRQCGPQSGVPRSLQQVNVKKDDCIVLRMVSPEGPLFQHHKLACITAGRLPVLRDITGSSTELPELGRNVQPATAAEDAYMLSRLPGLDWLETGNRSLKAIFKGTVRGRLTPERAAVFRQATVSHVVGPCDREHQLGLMQPVSSITSWCSDSVQSPAVITRFAPNLTVINVKISNVRRGPSLCLTLKPKMVSIDVQSGDPKGLYVTGIPSASLTHLCIQSHILKVSKDSYDWVDARNHQGYLAQNVRLSILDKQIVVLQPTDCATTVTLQC